MIKGCSASIKQMTTDTWKVCQKQIVPEPSSHFGTPNLRDAQTNWAPPEEYWRRHDCCSATCIAWSRPEQIKILGKFHRSVRRTWEPDTDLKGRNRSCRILTTRHNNTSLAAISVLLIVGHSRKQVDDSRASFTRVRDVSLEFRAIPLIVCLRSHDRPYYLFACPSPSQRPPGARDVPEHLEVAQSDGCLQVATLDLVSAFATMFRIGSLPKLTEQEFNESTIHSQAFGTAILTT